MQGVEEFRKLLLRPGENVLGKEPAAGAEFENFNLGGRVQGPPYFFELARQQAAKDGVHVTRGVKVSGLAKLLGVARVVAQFGMVQTQLHVPRKRDGPVLAYFLFDDGAQAHKPFR